MLIEGLDKIDNAILEVIKDHARRVILILVKKWGCPEWR